MNRDRSSTLCFGQLLFVIVAALLACESNGFAQEAKQKNKAAEAKESVSVLPPKVEAMLKGLPEDATVGIVVIDRRGRVVFEHNANVEMPAASSIKSHLLLELFAKYADELTESPRDDLAKIVQNEKHPAIAHFGAKNKALISKDLSGVSINQLGKILVDSEDQSGKKYANAVYNAASNVAIALLGGPEEATALIQKRDEAFSKVNLRRYMLQKRNVTGDNTASALGLATIFRKTVGKTPKGMNSKTAKSVASVLHYATYKNGAKSYYKGGTLYSDPVTKVRSGLYRSGKVRMNYAVMISQKLRTSKSGKTQYKAMSDLSQKIYDELKKTMLSRR